MSDFNLRAELRHILDTSDITDVDEITDKVIAAIPSEDLVDVLRQVLRPYVQNFMGTDRLRLIKSSGTEQKEPGDQAMLVGVGIKAQKGIGDKQAARLLAVIGDPYLNEQTGEIRNVAKLRAYCGVGDPDRKRTKGMNQAELFRCGNPVAKSRIYLIAESCLKAQDHYADVYYARKAATEGRLHKNECKRCGPSGKPAQAGTPWSNAHRHADALRVVGKTILRDLWIEAKRIHETGETA